MHLIPIKTYFAVFVVLTVLMLLTIGASFVHFGTLLNNLVAMAIATTKALLVLMYFMGVKYATKLTKLWAYAGFFGFLLMFLMFGDYSTRRYEPTARWTSDQGSALMRSVNESRQRSETQASPAEPGGEAEDPTSDGPREH